MAAARHFAAAEAARSPAPCAHALWLRAARAGHPEAQWWVGLAHYKGVGGVARDSEEALMWLGRSARALMELTGLSLEGVSGMERVERGGQRPAATLARGRSVGALVGGNGGEGGGAAEGGLSMCGGGEGAGEGLPALMEPADCTRVLSSAAHLMG